MKRDDHHAIRVAGIGRITAAAISATGEGRAWAITVMLHAALALALWAVVWAACAPPPEEYPPYLVPMLPALAQGDRLPPELQDAPQEPLPEQATAASPATAAEPSESPPSRFDAAANCAEVAKPLEPATAAMTTAGANLIAIGAAGGAPGFGGALGSGGGPRASSRRRAIVCYCGSPGSINAVERALRWFKRHQSANGMWEAERYQGNCGESPKCEPGSARSSGGSAVDIALTAYALLCYLGDGYDQRTPSLYRTTVMKGLDYLCSVQTADGALGERNYEHAVATSALCEAYAISGDPALRAPAQRAVNIILARQSRGGAGEAGYGDGLGWDYRESNPARNDASVTGWNVMALRSASNAGLAVGNGLGGARRWLEGAWKASNPGWRTLSDPYTATSQFAYTWDAIGGTVDIGAPGSDAHDLVPVGGMCAVFLGGHAGDMLLESLANHVVTYQLPTAYPCNTYALYYNTYTMFQVGGQRWATWNGIVRDMLVKAQRRGDGCLDGSWDWEGTRFHGHDVGRVLSTAYCCLCLEVYYREGRQLLGADKR